MALALGANTGSAVWLIVLAGLSTEPEGLHAQQGVTLPLSTGCNKDGGLVPVLDAVPLHY